MNLFNFPLQIQSEILNRMELSEIFSLSFCSQKTKEIIRNHWMIPLKMHIQLVPSDSNQTVFSIGTDDDNLSKILISEREFLLEEDTVSLKFSDTVVLSCGVFWSSYGTVWIKYDPEDSPNAAITDYLKDLFSIE
uniref:F-box domain-containing protein n=1 Tax=Caenorhabditis tropicalis TaxID=1561998 RepID=A0A1I7UJ75_9PELO